MLPFVIPVIRGGPDCPEPVIKRDECNPVKGGQICIDCRSAKGDFVEVKEVSGHAHKTAAGLTIGDRCSATRTSLGTIATGHQLTKDSLLAKTSFLIVDGRCAQGVQFEIQARQREALQLYACLRERRCEAPKEVVDFGLKNGSRIREPMDYVARARHRNS